MKKQIVYTIVLICAMQFLSPVGFSQFNRGGLTNKPGQPPPPPPPPMDTDVPIDGGLSLLIVAGAGFGIKKYRNRQSKKVSEKA